MGRKLKKYEKYSDKMTHVPDGVIRLIGIEVDVDASEVLYRAEEIDGSFLTEDAEVMGGDWYVEDGWLVGKHGECSPGMVVMKPDFFGDIMVEFEAEMVAPSTHDINVMIHGSWNREKNERDVAYVTGLEGFWRGSVGFEKSPDYKMFLATSLLDFEPAQTYTVRFGNVGERLFVTVNGRTALEINDPDPIDRMKYGKIGFEAFASWWRLKNLCVRRLKSTRFGEEYIPEF